MSRSPRYVCQACGAASGKWAGRCENCGEWNRIIEEAAAPTPPKGVGAGRGRAMRLEPMAGPAPGVPRAATGVAEFDTVTGGGLVPGAAVLLGGEPGIGKSTLMLQVAARIAAGANAAVIYVTGEEAVEQIRQRAHRLGLGEAPVQLAAATAIQDILATLDEAAPRVVIIDSIQTMFTPELDSAPGSVAQVRGCAAALIAQSKRQGSTLFLLGHVTKEGLIAGPRVLEHMVDTVLTFEGERGHQFRILRATKNRFGPADEIGVFTMTAAGLAEVANPSALFLPEGSGTTSGSVVFAGIEGTRPLLVEIQALVAPSPLGTPRRAVVGWDQARLAMVLAVLDARCGVSLADRDVYLNVTGGLRIAEPALDLAAAAALTSSLTGRPIPEGTVVFGEVGLSGDVRPVSQEELRRKEAARLGFANAWCPVRRTGAAGGDGVVEFGHVADLVARIGGKPGDVRPIRRREA